MAELHRLLGLPDDTEPDRLRAAYEQHMSDAMRSNNHTRALALSTAFDALPDSHRGQVYRRLTTTGSTSAARWPAASGGGSRRQRMPRSRRPRSARSLGRFLIIVLGIAAAVFLIAHYQQRPGTIHQAGPFQRQDETVDSALISNDLDGRFGRDDIRCPSGRFEPGSTITCQSGDGATWTVAINGPPDGYNVLSSMPGRSVQSAEQDARQAVATITQCRALTRGALPPAMAPAVGQATFRCGQSTLTLSLQSGNVLDYQRTNRRTYRLTITAANGEAVRYNSATGRYST
jgi:hypothetical protein